MKRTLIAIAGLMLVASGCATDNDTAEPGVETSAPATGTEEPTGAATNKRGAIEATLGDPISVPGFIDITDTALSAKGCPENADFPGEVTKMAFSATVQIHDATQIQWLWPTDFYYVDDAGKVTRNFDVSDANPCPGGSQVIDLPPNSAADARVTLDIPTTTVAIGYAITSGNGQRVEWKLPADALADASAPTG